MTRLSQALGQPDRAPEASAAPLLFLDFDGFKMVNDRLGHDAGDGLLAAAAQRLARRIRPGDFIARFGGDEFAVLLAPATGREAAIRVAEDLVADIASPFDVDGHEVAITVSVGIVVSPEITERSDLLRAADIAHYRAKAAGKGAIAVFDAVQDGMSLDRRQGHRRPMPPPGRARY